MSILSGVLSGGSLVLAALGAAIDESHHPFKRSLIRPGGPGGKRDEETHEWVCEGRPSTRGAYVQKCVNVHNPDRKPKIVKINKAYKKKYNKLYRAGKFPKAKRFKIDERHPRAAYNPKKSQYAAKRKKARSKAR
jgi:hypothetical protein